VIDLSKAPRQEEYLAAMVTKITGVKRPRLQTWLENGWIEPSIQAGTGAGSRNIFSRNDLYVIGIFKMITEIGLPREIVGDVISKIKGEFDSPLTNFSDEGLEYCKHTIFYCAVGDLSNAVLLTGNDFYFGETISSLKMDGYDYAFIFNIVPIIEDIDKKIKTVK